ncbi:fungal-specific transcription factor domain-containing protein [Blakeslea trispora]|nr:fungal-specific transcription factor domain-containing protein [Blakeslea trispora]
MMENKSTVGGLFSLKNKASLGGSKRIKISRACDECRKRKVKCDGVQPCSRCRKSNTECVFAKLPPKRGPPKQYMENLENRLQRVEKALKSLTLPVRKIFEDALSNEKKGSLTESSASSVKQSMTASVAPHHASLKQPTQQYATSSPDPILDRFTVNEIGQAAYVNDYKLRIDRISGESRHARHLHDDTQSDISDSPMSSSAASFLQQNGPIYSVGLEQPLPEHLMTSRQFMTEVQGLTDVYFEHVHKYMPMIHKPSFLKQMHSITNAPSLLLLLSMCSVASRWVHTGQQDLYHQYNHHSYPSSHHSPHVSNPATAQLSSSSSSSSPLDRRSSPASTTSTIPGHHYYLRALDILDEYLDAPRLSTVQALLLLVKYQESAPRAGYFHRAYTYLGMAVNMCNDLGLSQFVEQDPLYDAETRRRTFWVAYMYDLLMSIEHGHATYFNVHQCTTGFPLVTSEEGPALEELITNQNILIQLGKVLSDIYTMARRMTQRQQSQGYQRTDEQMVEEQARLFSLHTHLENFLYEVPPSLVYQPTQDIENYPVDKQAIGDPFVGFLHMTYHFSIILLHRIYMHQPPPKTEFNFIAYPHRKLCATSASNITTIVETLYNKHPVEILCYPIRGVQHTIHCLSMAATIHKYEMAHAENPYMSNQARYQYMVSVDLIQKLSNHSPSAEFSKYYYQSPPNRTTEKRMSAPPPLDYTQIEHRSPTKARRNTLSAMSMEGLSQSSTNPPVIVPEMNNTVVAMTNTLYPPSTQLNDPSQLAALMSSPNSSQYHLQHPMAAPSQPWSEPFQSHISIQSWNQQQPQQHLHQSMSSTEYYSSDGHMNAMDTAYPSNHNTTLAASDFAQLNHHGRVRRHTHSYQPMPENYYPDTVTPSTDAFNLTMQTDTQAPLGPDMVVVQDEDVVMNSHYDPSSGMSQLFLTDSHASHPPFFK